MVKFTFLKALGLAIFFALNLVAAPSPAFQDLESVVGTYRRLPVENGWHVGSIKIIDRGGIKSLQWKNNADVAWSLVPDFEKGQLKTDSTNPYFDDGQKAFHLIFQEDQVVGFRFGQDTLVRDGFSIKPQRNSLTQRSGGFHGYISMDTESPPEGFGYGASFYVGIWPLIPEPLSGFQIGLPSTWIIPDNRNFEHPLCPPGTFARDNWPERGPYYRDVFQTIEGGLGYWVSTQFPSTTPKYRMNGTPNGYNHEISSPGWGFGRTQSLAPEKMGIAQLSNRLLVPPDGMTFPENSSGQILGNAWMVLSLTTKKSSTASTPTGDHSWTLFLNSKNFKGPVAFWIPETWSRLSQIDKSINARGLDSRIGLMGGGAMEVNTVPYFESVDEAGTNYSRIPDLHFPVNERGETILMRDVVFYAKDAVGSSGNFISNKTWRPKLTAVPISFDQGPENSKLNEIDRSVQTKIFGEPGKQAFGLQWNDARGKGHLPEYFKEVGKDRIATSKDTVPNSTGLKKQQFDRNINTNGYESPKSGVWTDPGPSSKSFEVSLTDGSVVTFAWYRFIDQPSIRALNWSDEERANLQRRVEQIHANWPIDRSYIPMPSSGELVTMDGALIVTPPSGLEVGYVPIAIRQELETK